MPMANLEEKIKNKSARIAILGVGYVGLPLAVAFAQEGFTVFPIDKNERKVSLLKKGISYIDDVASEDIQEVLEKGLFYPTSSYEVLEEADVAIITVPTPVTRNKSPDLSFIMEASEGIKRHFNIPMLICLESTTYPSTTEEQLLPLFEEEGYRVGKDFYLAFSPERINPGDKEHTLRNTPKIVGGVTKECTRVASLLYKQICQEVVPVSNARTAEMIKLFENSFRYVNIAFVNEMAIICKKLGIDIWEVIKGAKSKGFGFMEFKPGPGVGGHCIPVDPHYLAWHTKGLGHNTLLLEIADSINSTMPYYVVDLIREILNQESKPLKGSHVLILGVTYKPDVKDIREAPSIKIMEILKNKGAEVLFHDPYQESVEVNSILYESVPLEEQILKEADIAVMITNHSFYEDKLQWIADNCKCILDTRNAFEKVNSPAKIYKL